MKKLSLLLGILMIAGASYACDGNKDKACCKKGEKKECAKSTAKACCKKGEKKDCAEAHAKKDETKDPTVEKKS